jgi:hypothetical protein
MRGLAGRLVDSRWIKFRTGKAAVGSVSPSFKFAVSASYSLSTVTYLSSIELRGDGILQGILRRLYLAVSPSLAEDRNR